MTADADADALLAAARALTPLIRAHADQAERDRRLPQPAVDAIARAGLFRATVPRAVGGHEADQVTFLRLVEEIARVDGSAGWCFMIGAEANGIVGAWLPPPVAADLFGANPRIITGGSLVLGGRARVVDGGYRLSGRWRFTSGCQYCDYLFADCTIDDGAAPPRVRVMLFPRAQCQIIDVWSVVGLRGTGSNDFTLDDLFVPADRSFDPFAEPPAQQTLMARLPLGGCLSLNKAAVAIGIARGAIDAFIDLAATKRGLFASSPLRDDPRIQLQLGEAEACLQTGRAFLFNAAADAWKVVVGGATVDQRQTALMHLAAVHAAKRSAEAVDILFQAAGTAAIFSPSPLERAFRDIHVATQHITVLPRMQQDAGRVLLGLEPTEPFF